jgi:erythromycin esterase-like protein
MLTESLRAVSVVAVSVMAIPVVAQDEPDSRVEWLKSNAVRIRTIDPQDTDFADLEPLIGKIGDARVVALGEQSHGDGAAFLAKGRLIRFLHERMGFDVLAWESGMFDCSQIDAALRSEASTRDAAERGIFPIWTASGHAIPVFEYVRTTLATPHPIEVAGVDCQFSSRQARKAFPAAVQEFFDRVDPAILAGSDAGGPGAAIRSIVGRLESEPQQDVSDQAKADAKAVQDLIHMIDSKAESFRRVHSARQIAFMKRCLQNLLVFEQVHRQTCPGGEDPSLTNLRDKTMGENLAWLAREYYPDRKIIVWAASFHLMRNAPSVTVTGGKLDYTRTVPMGHVARQLLGSDYYSFMMTAYKGRAGNPFRNAADIGRASADSLEGLLNRAGYRYAFVDFRSLGQESWLRGKIEARPLGYARMEARWPEVFDAVLFTRDMFPSTSDGAVPEGVRTAKAETPTGPRADLAAAIEDLRKTLVTYQLGSDAVFPQKMPAMGDPARLDLFPSAQAWPEVLGFMERNVNEYRLLPGDKDTISPDSATPALAFTSPLAGKVISSGSGAVVCLQGVAPQGVVTEEGYCTLICRGDMAGKVGLNSYTTMLIDGDLSGEVAARSYFVGAIRGRLTGKLVLNSYAMVYLFGGLDGRAELSHSKLAIAGRVTREQLQQITGTGRVFVEDSDLPPGTHKLGTLTLTVGVNIGTPTSRTRSSGERSIIPREEGVAPKQPAAMTQIALAATTQLSPAATTHPAAVAPGTSASHAEADAAPVSDPSGMPANRAVLPFTIAANGLTVILRPIEGAENVVLLTLYKIGGDQDPAGKSGLAHLIEHLYTVCPAGTTPGRTAEDFMRDYPAGWNAQTGADYTVYATVVRPDALERELTDAAGRMKDLHVSEKDLVREQARVIGELARMYEGPPALAGLNQARARLDLRYGHQRPGGIPDQVRRIGLADVQERLAQYYKPPNAILVLAGRFDPTLARGMIEKSFGMIPVGMAAPPAVRCEQASMPDANVEVTVKPVKAGQQTLITFGYPSPGPQHAMYPPYIVLVSRLWAAAKDLAEPELPMPVWFAPLDAGSAICIQTFVKDQETQGQACERLQKFLNEILARPMEAGEPAACMGNLASFLDTGIVPDRVLAGNPYGVAFAHARWQQMGIDRVQLVEKIGGVSGGQLPFCAKVWFSGPKRVTAIVRPRQ